MTIPIPNPHIAISMLAFFQGTQLNLFERFLTQAVAGIDSTSITSGMQNVAYVILLVGFLWQVYQSALHGGDVRGLGTNLIKYIVTALVIMNYGAVFTTIRAVIFERCRQGAVQGISIDRCGAVSITDVEDAMDRANAYEAAGVDALFFSGVKTRVQLDILSSATKLPLILGTSGAELMNLDYLANRRIKICLQGHQPALAAVQAVYSTLMALKNGVSAVELKGLPSGELIKRLTRDDKNEKMTNDFLGGASLARRD